MPWREQAFVSWAGLRGAVPIVLATFPITAGLPQAERIFDVTFLLVAVFTLVQGPTLPWLASRLAAALPGEDRGRSQGVGEGRRGSAMLIVRGTGGRPRRTE